MLIEDEGGQLMLFDPDWESGKTCLDASAPPMALTSNRYSNRSLELKNQTFMLLDLRPGAGNMLGPYWELDPVWLGCNGMLNTMLSLNGASVCSLSSILQDTVPFKYYLTRQACLGILRRAKERGKELPPQLELALKVQAGLLPPDAMHERKPIAFAANQRDEVRDLHDVAGALGAQPGMKQQTFIAENCLTPWDTQQARIFTPEGKAPTVAGADGGGGRNPAGLVFTAAFNAGAGPGAGGIGYTVDGTPTLKASESGTNQVPAVLCLNDQRGRRFDLSEDITGTLCAQEHGREPLVMEDQPELFENHGIDARYRGPFDVAPTMSARYGTGGNNVPLIRQESEPVYCITGNIVDRQPQNGGNGIGYQEDIAYTLTATDKHCIFSRQRVDVFREDDIASTESARQHKDATDLVYQETVGALTSSDRKGPNSQYVSQDKCVIEGPSLIRRLMPSECELLQGFPLGWTDIPDVPSSDAARYKALGNSVCLMKAIMVIYRIKLAIFKGFPLIYCA